MKSPKFRKILISWAWINILLAGYLLVSLFIQIEDIFPSLFHFAESDIFFQLLSVISISIFLIVFLLRNRIERALFHIKSDFERVNNTIAEEDLVQFRTNKLDWVLKGIVVLFGIYIIFLSLTDVNTYSRLIWEDGVIEYVSAILWFLAAIFSFIILLRRKALCKAKFCAYWLLMLFFVLCAGEEISWGQRLFKFGDLEIVSLINRQDETTLHNIGSTSIFSNLFFLFTLIFFLIIPYLKRKYKGLHKYMSYYDLPILKPSIIHIYLLSLIVWLFLGIRFGTLGFHPFTIWGYYTQMDDEIFELLTAYSFFTFSFLDLIWRWKNINRVSYSALQ